MTNLRLAQRLGQLTLALTLLLLTRRARAQGTGDWPEPRHDRHLTSIQPLPGAMTHSPALIAQLDLGRTPPGWQEIDLDNGRGKARLTIISGELRCYNVQGRLRWTCHPPGINFSNIVAASDLDGDGHIDIALSAGRTAQPYGAALVVSADDGKVLWRYDVEPMSYSWQLYVLDQRGIAGKAKGPKQLFVVMHGYPPDEKNGYCARFNHTDKGWQQTWRYDFPEYTCFPSVHQTDVDGDGVKEIAIITHSRMWVMNAADGAVKQFLKWDVSPSNIRSYGLNRFVDLNGDGTEDFLCLANFSKHYEVLLNEDGKFKEAWHFGWPDSVTVGTVGLCWPLPPDGDVDGDGKKDIVASVFNSDGNHQWEIRVHDAATGELKCRQPGMIAARVADADGDKRAEILAERSDEGSDVEPDGGYVVQHPTGAVLLKMKDQKLRVIWEDPQAVAVREEEHIPRVRVGDELRVLVHDPNGAIQTQWDPTAGVQTTTPSIPPGPTELLVADVLGEGRNQLIVYRQRKATIWKVGDGRFRSAGEYDSTCLPAIADLDGDGKRELVLADVAEGHLPRFKAVTPALHDKVLWDIQLPPPKQTGLPQPRIAYMRVGKFTGREHDDIYAWIGTPLVRSVVLNGGTGELVWEKFRLPDSERYWGPSQNLASSYDLNADGKEDLIFTDPDEYCAASGTTGDFVLGPLTQQKIFNQPSQGLYTMPVLLGQSQGTRLCLVGGHYFQGVCSPDAKPAWYALPKCGQARCANEGFIQLSDGNFAMGFGRQNGKFACLNVKDGSLRWELDVQASCSDAAACDIDGDGHQDFIFGTSHGALYAVADDGDKPRVVWKLDTGTALSAPVIADVDGDGKSDVIIPGEDGRVRVYGTPK